MLLDGLVGSTVIENASDTAILEAMSDEDMSQLLAITLEDTLSPEELSNFVAEMAEADGVDYIEERTIVKLDKQAKKTRNYKMAILQCAKEGNDPNYKKICTLWKMERFLMRAMEKKWMTKAKARVKTMGNKVDKSEAGPVKAIKTRLTRAQRDTAASKKTLKVDPKLKAETSTVMKKLTAKVG